MEILQIHTCGARLSLSAADWEVLLDKTDGYSGCDLANLISSALLEPMRDMLEATHWVTTSSKFCCNTIAEQHD
jgi:vacuolar protein-sorting-associated protein 4